MSFKTKNNNSVKKNKTDNDIVVDYNDDNEEKILKDNKKRERVDKESKFDKIDWVNNAPNEKNTTKFDKIDWINKGSQEKKVKKCDSIHWMGDSEDKNTISKRKENRDVPIKRGVKISNINYDLESQPKKIGKYPTDNFINDLLKAVVQVDPNLDSLSITKLREYVSIKYFGRGKEFLKHIFGRLKNPNNSGYNPDYKFSKKQIKMLEENLLSSNKEIGLSSKIVEKYQKCNPNLKDYSHQQWQVKEPKLKYDYFKRINTKDKAYWLGFLCRDGAITSGKNSTIKRYQLAIELGVKDKIHLLKFCEVLGLNPKNKLNERERIIDYHGEKKKFTLINVQFTCKPLFKDLERIKFKEIPDFVLNLNENNREHALSWLLGVYDADRIEGTTKICSSEKWFLDKIKDVFDIKYKVYVKNEPSPDDIIKSRRIVWELSLGAVLFNEMISSTENCVDSLERKRRYFDTYREAYDLLKSKVENESNLQFLVDRFSVQDVANGLEVNIKTLRKLMNEWNISAPIKKKSCNKTLSEIIQLKNEKN
ncbi:MAG: hypothetical protein ACFFFB_16215 [Candidatus Heimdallarchaeota archaeon]